MISDMVVLVPDPVVVMIPGKRVRVQVPDEGKPNNVTLPVAKVQVGAVIGPTDGGVGVDGCAFITISSDGGDIQPVELATV